MKDAGVKGAAIGSAASTSGPANTVTIRSGSAKSVTTQGAAARSGATNGGGTKSGAAKSGTTKSAATKSGATKSGASKSGGVKSGATKSAAAGSPTRRAARPAPHASPLEMDRRWIARALVGVVVVAFFVLIGRAAVLAFKSDAGRLSSIDRAMPPPSSTVPARH